MATNIAAAIDIHPAALRGSIGATLPGGQVSLVAYANALLSQNAVQAADAKNSDDFQTQYVATLQTQSQSISATQCRPGAREPDRVYQNSYQAAARVMTTANALLEALLAIQ